MANAVAEAFRDDEPLLFEAGTGIGKSLAYLVPGIIHATDCGRQLIVSTHTISLQEQVEKNDLPLCRRLFGLVPELGRYAGFTATVLVGKSNYLCTSRLSHALAERASLFDDAGYAELLRIAGWAAATATGLRHDLQPQPDPEVWDSVNADSSSCSRRSCDCSKCFYQRARARVRSAQVIVVNHALLFSLINAGGARAEGAADAGGVLFPGDFVVLDEAHTVPEVAQESFGLSLSSLGVERSLRHLYNPKTRRGIMARRADAELRQRVADALESSSQFFAFLAGGLLAERTVVRVREEGVAEALPCEPLSALERCVAGAADRLEDGRERDELLEHMPRERARELAGMLAYEEDSAGGIMTTSLAVAHLEETVEAVRERLRQLADHRGELDGVAVVDADGVLMADVTLFDLVIADLHSSLADLVGDEAPLTVRPGASIREVAAQLTEARRSSVLVVEEGRPIGRILADDVVDALLPERGRLHFPRFLQ